MAAEQGKDTPDGRVPRLNTERAGPFVDVGPENREG